MNESSIILLKDKNALFYFESISLFGEEFDGFSCSSRSCKNEDFRIVMHKDNFPHFEFERRVPSMGSNKCSETLSYSSVLASMFDFNDFYLVKISTGTDLRCYISLF